MAASTHWIATATAQSVLERGGNAFDAACAGAFVLHVVEPHLNGPGGDMTAVLASAADPGRPRVLAGQGPAPAAATMEHYRSEGLDLVPGSGALASAVPGAVDAWLLLLREHGTWTVRDVLAHAIGYARDGHPVLERVALTIAAVQGLFREHWPTSAAHWMPGGAPPSPGDLVTNPAYADLLESLVEAADGAGSRGAGVDAARRRWRELTGPAIEEFVRTPHRHSDGADHAGVITAADVAGFRATFEEPVTARFRDCTVAKTAAWGQGPALLQTLTILDGYDDEFLDPSTVAGVHTIAEAQKLALADRDVWYGDVAPSCADTGPAAGATGPAVPGSGSAAPDAAANAVPLGHLLSTEYAARRRALIDVTASHELRPGEVPGRTTPPVPPLRTEYATTAPAGSLPGAPTGGAAAGVGEPTVPHEPAAAEPSPDARGVTRGDTCHIDVVDRWGNMISATPSGGWLQSSPTIPALGFCLGTRLQMTWLDPASPSALVPGRRPRTTLTPTLVLRDGEPVLACGSPGGDQQDQWQLLFLLRVLVGGYTPQEAIDAPAWHTTSFPGSFWPRTWTPGGLVVEDRLGADVITALSARGHRITRAGDWTLGRLSAVTREPSTGVLGAAANSRGAQGYAAGR
ncbi:gamma-glutamyltransferase [Myceligenerans salitolerans]|uniref:Gamma-glutamyltransferase n=2 Tax=Myceligenerans salitolerans TaxID=1230528 RepID=A0ABS3I7Q8_9MICO|nr:gamma-glutamyltransferase [Myceligenerans salitolerans]MBO0609042.1 gamma-glutamyltransferase [Myceligenerans salitolerans]